MQPLFNLYGVLNPMKVAARLTRQGGAMDATRVGHVMNESMLLFKRRAREARVPRKNNEAVEQQKSVNVKEIRNENYW